MDTGFPEELLSKLLKMLHVTLWVPTGFQKSPQSGWGGKPGKRRDEGKPRMWARAYRARVQEGQTMVQEPRHRGCVLEGLGGWGLA